MTVINPNLTGLFPVADDNSGVTGINLSNLNNSNTGKAASSNLGNVLTTRQLYNFYDKNGADQLQKIINDPKTKNEVESFKAQIANLKSVDEIFTNHKLYSFITTALGIPDADTQKGLVKQALTSYSIDPATFKKLVTNNLLDKNGRPVNAAAQDELLKQGYLDPKNPTRGSVANSLTNPVYAQAAQILQLAQSGITTLKDPNTIKTIVQQYQAAKFETKIINENSSVQVARFFLKNASSFKDVNQVLASKNARNFVQTVFDIPPQIAIQPLQAQQKIFSRYIDVKKLSDPKYVDGLIQKFLNKTDLNNSGTSTQSRNAVALEALKS